MYVYSNLGTLHLDVHVRLCVKIRYKEKITMRPSHHTQHYWQNPCYAWAEEYNIFMKPQY